MKFDTQQIAMVALGAAAAILVAKKAGGKKMTTPMAIGAAATVGALAGVTANDAYNKKKSQDALNRAASGLLPGA